MNYRVLKIKVLYTIVFLSLLITIGFSQDHYDLVTGNLIQFNDNGFWCWYQDERAILDISGGKLILGSDASGYGIGGSLRDGNVENVIFDLKTMLPERSVLKVGGGNFYCDDHHTPAFLLRPDGRYLGFYAAHFGEYKSFYKIYNTDAWGIEYEFDWDAEIPGGTNFQTTYSNLFYLSNEGRMYNFVRSNNKSPNFMYSDDMGDTWSYGGQLTEGGGVGYNNGYYKYWSNGFGRIDFICTEYHPRDYNTSIYHGYVKNGKTYNSDGTVADADIYDNSAIPTTDDLTIVFAANTVLNSYTMTRCWNMDVQTYNDGTIATLIKARINDNPDNPSNDPDHCFIYCLHNGTLWTSTYLCKAGKKMYYSEQDYVGLGAIHPSNPYVIYISTPYDPRDDITNLGVHEIFKGVSSDNGTNWTWTPVTQNSERDNFRPIIPAWNINYTALLWCRGTYYAAQSFDAAIVGIIDYPGNNPELMNYVDASAVNTSLADDSPLITTGPDANEGAADDLWHERTGLGNDGSVLTSSEIDGENAPALKTRLTLPEEGTYDVWVNFWADPDYDWRIKAGLSSNNMQIFRQMASKQVEDGDHNTTLVLTGSNNTFLYQAYLGRYQASSDTIIEVFIDDWAIQTGTENTLTGDTARTWYDGVSFAAAESINSINVYENDDSPVEFSLSQNYPNPFKETTSITFSFLNDAYVSLRVYNIVGQELVTLVDKEVPAGSYNIEWNAENSPSGIYFYKMTVGNYSKTNKMILIK
jgi:hypothetical protein